jgi:DNA-binding transcriptional LysR family regulator
MPTASTTNTKAKPRLNQPRTKSPTDSPEEAFNEPYEVAAGAQSPWVRRRRIKLAELVNESWTLPPPKNVIATVAMEVFRASGLDYPRTIVVADNAQARIGLVATGRFLTILQASALRFPTGQPPDGSF